MTKLVDVIQATKPIIGMIHFPPLVGYPDYPGVDFIRRRILREAKILEKNGVHAIMIENNYDVPHKEFVDPEIGAVMSVLTQSVRETVRIPVGVDVLWNDHKTALAICAATGASFIRISAFVDDVRTKYGDMIARGKEAMVYRKKLGLETIVAIFSDVHVKHSTMIDVNKSLETSVREAVDVGADGIIITGKVTGDPPTLEDLKTAKANAGVPILIGSGSTATNLNTLIGLSDGIIVGTALMTNRVIDERKVNAYMEAYRNI